MIRFGSFVSVVILNCSTFRLFSTNIHVLAESTIRLILKPICHLNVVRVVSCVSLNRQSAM